MGDICGRRVDIASSHSSTSIIYLPVRHVLLDGTRLGGRIRGNNQSMTLSSPYLASPHSLFLPKPKPLTARDLLTRQRFATTPSPALTLFNSIRRRLMGSEGQMSLKSCHSLVLPLTKHSVESHGTLQGYPNANQLLNIAHSLTLSEPTKISDPPSQLAWPFSLRMFSISNS